MRSRKVVVIILLMLVLAGCDTAQSAKVNILRVMHPAGNFPAFSTTANNAAAVQHFYNLAYGLPSPQGTLNCPNDDGTVYNLTFLNGTTSVQTMVLDASGCQFLHITNDIQNVRMTKQTFVNTFLKLTGLPSLIPYHKPQQYGHYQIIVSIREVASRV